MHRRRLLGPSSYVVYGRSPRCDHPDVRSCPELSISASGPLSSAARSHLYTAPTASGRCCANGMASAQAIRSSSPPRTSSSDQPEALRCMPNCRRKPLSIVYTLWQTETGEIITTLPAPTTLSRQRRPSLLLSRTSLVGPTARLEALLRNLCSPPCRAERSVSAITARRATFQCRSRQYFTGTAAAVTRGYYDTGRRRLLNLSATARPAEIESALVSHPLVAEAAVSLPHDTRARLYCYVTLMESRGGSNAGE